MGLAELIVGLIVFIGTHLFVTMRGRRAAVIARIGEWPYKGLFSLLSLVGILLIGSGFARYRTEGTIPVWDPPLWTHYIVEALMWPASIFLVAAYIPGGIKRVLKHPMLVAIKIWAFAHLCANGDLGSIVLFGSILAWAVYDRVTLKRRTDPGSPPIPLGGRTNDIIAIVVGTIVYLALGFVFHPIVIGVPAFAMGH
jgi:uncharacterized membrane protein